MRAGPMSNLSRAVVTTLGVAVLASACRPDEPPPAPPEQPTEPAPDEAPPEPMVWETYQMAWLADTGAVNRAVAVAPGGWVVSLNQEQIRVHAPDTGKVLEAADQCGGPAEGLFFTEPQKAIVVCARELREVRFPGLEWRRITTLPFDAGLVDAAGGLLAVSDGQHRVAVFETNAWTRIDESKLDEQIVDIELSEDGSLLAIGGELGTSYVRDVGAKSSRALTTSDRKPTAIAFSPSHNQMFVHDVTLEARVVGLAKGETRYTFKTGNALNHAVWLADDLVAVTGSEGLVLYLAGDKEPHQLAYPGKSGGEPVTVGIGASADGSIVCAGDEEGRIACFANAELGEVTYPTTPPPAG